MINEGERGGLGERGGGLVGENVVTCTQIQYSLKTDNTHLGALQPAIPFGGGLLGSKKGDSEHFFLISILLYIIFISR